MKIPCAILRIVYTSTFFYTDLLVLLRFGFKQIIFYGTYCRSLNCDLKQYLF